MAEIEDLLFRDPAQQVRPRIHARRSVTLEVNEIPRLIAVSAAKEMVESDFEQRGQRRVGRDMAANPCVRFVLAMHHRHRVPAGQALQAPLQLAVARIWHLLFDRNGIDIRRV